MSDSEIVSVPRWEKLRRAGEDDAPRFGVRHLLVLITFAAVHMGLIRTIAPGTPNLTGTAYVVLQSLLLGLAFTGAFELILRTLWRTHWRVEPGHWLLAAIGFSAAFQNLAELANYVLPREVFATLGIYITLMGLFLMPLMLARRTPLIWKIFAAMQLFFLWQNIVLFMPAFRTEYSQAVSHTIGLCEAPATLLFIAIATVVDPERKQRRWLHWSGVAVWVCSRAIPGILAGLGL